MKEEYNSSGLDLKDVVGTDNKLNTFINNTHLSPKLTTIPKLGPNTEKELGFKKTGQITTTTQLVGKFCEFNLEFEKCLEWMRSVVTFNQCKQIVTVVLYKLEMMGFLVPRVAENWRHF